MKSIFIIHYFYNPALTLILDNNSVYHKYMTYGFLFLVIYFYKKQPLKQNQIIIRILT